MAAPKQTDPQFKLRFTPELRDQIEAAAKANNRSMNAEIVARLEAYDALHSRVAELAAEKLHLTGELEAIKAELAEARSQSDPKGTADLWDSVVSLLTQVREHQKEDDKKLSELREIGMYLRGDALCLNAELSNEIWKPSAVRPTLETSVARDLADAIDQRSWALIKAARKTAQGAREHEASAILARHLRHQVLGDSLTDDVLVAFLKEVDGLATPLHAADFYDKVSEMIRDAPDEMREAYQAALDAVMPKLFKGWPDDWY